MELPELLEVGAVARLVEIEDGQDESGAVMVAADAAGRLDVLGSALGLFGDDH